MKPVEAAPKTTPHISTVNSSRPYGSMSAM